MIKLQNTVNILIHFKIMVGDYVCIKIKYLNLT